jgi:hypothetical protein
MIDGDEAVAGRTRCCQTVRFVPDLGDNQKQQVR